MGGLVIFPTGAAFRTVASRNSTKSPTWHSRSFSCSWPEPASRFPIPRRVV